MTAGTPESMIMNFGHNKLSESSLIQKQNFEARSWKVKVLLEFLNRSIKLLIKSCVYVEKTSNRTGSSPRIADPSTFTRLGCRNAHLFTLMFIDHVYFSFHNHAKSCILFELLAPEKHLPFWLENLLESSFADKTSYLKSVCRPRWSSQ